MKNLIVFAGAGASRGVSAEKYPMALDFRKRLPNSITESRPYQLLTQHIGKQGLGESIDIEHILWELGYVVDELHGLTDPKQFISFLLATNQINNIVPTHNSGPNIHSQFQQLLAIAKKLQDQINERVYDFYAQPPTAEELSSSWLPLLGWLPSAHFERVDIFTTNYDLVIESALEKRTEPLVDLGFSQGLFPGINLGAWRDSDSTTGLLTKLHGSVDWKLGNGGSESEPIIRRGHPEFDGDHRKRLILYPGFKGVPAREPFVAFHNYFRQRLQQATHVLFIGFAFRDDFINEIIATELKSDAEVTVVNPAVELPHLPFLAKAQHLQQAFGLKSNLSLLASGGHTPFSTKDLEHWKK